MFKFLFSLVVTSSVVLRNGSSITVTQAPSVNIQGDLILDPYSKITYDTTGASPLSPIVIQGCATFAGTLVVELNQTADQILSNMNISIFDYTCRNGKFDFIEVKTIGSNCSIAGTPTYKTSTLIVAFELKALRDCGQVATLGSRVDIGKHFLIWLPVFIRFLFRFRLSYCSP
jgi:hypothetical protein